MADDLIRVGFPSGTVLAYAGATVPSGFLLCDGTSVSRTTYASLFNAIGTAWGTASGSTFNVPDLRGAFPRGVDGSAGRDPDKLTRTAITTGGNTGNAVGTLQTDGFRSHVHNLPIVNNQAASAGSGVPSLTGFGPDTAATGGNETRPVNAYVNYIVKI
jgi:microcystin-dependent protein